MASGFQGLVSVAEVGEMGHSPVPEPRQDGEGKFGLGAAPLPGDAGCAERQHPVAQITDVWAFNFQRIEMLSDIGEEALHTLQPYIASLVLMN